MELIEIGQICNTHGVRGEVKLNPWTDNLYDLLDLDVLYLKDGTILTIDNARVHKNTVIFKFREVENMSAAEKMRGTTLYTEKTSLPEGRYYIKDLIGLKAIDENGAFGKLTDVFNTGANDIYEIKTDDGKTLYVPVIEGVIGEVSLSAGTIFIIIPEGLED